jgi:hypothetical protein
MFPKHVRSSIFNPNIVLRNVFTKSVNLCRVFRIQEQVLYPDRTTDLTITTLMLHMCRMVYRRSTAYGNSKRKIYNRK